MLYINTLWGEGTLDLVCSILHIRVLNDSSLEKKSHLQHFPTCQHVMKFNHLFTQLTAFHSKTRESGCGFRPAHSQKQEAVFFQCCLWRLLTMQDTVPQQA